MGVDFIMNCAAAFEKSWDKNLLEACQPSLLTQVPAGERRSYLAIPKAGHNLESGRWYEVEIDRGEVVLLDGIDTVAVFQSLPESQVDLIRNCPGKTAAAYIHRVFVESGAAEATIT